MVLDLRIYDTPEQENIRSNLSNARNWLDTYFAVSVVPFSVNYETRKGNYKSKMYYCLVPENQMYSNEYVEYMAEDLKESFKDSHPYLKRCAIIPTIPLGNLYFKGMASSVIESAKSLIELAESDDQDGSLIVELKKQNMKNLLYHRCNLPLIRIDYSYETARGNRKEAYKFAIGNDESKAEEALESFINKFNNEKPYRPLLNVQILNCGIKGYIQAA